MSCRYSEQVERLIFQERDLCVGRDKCHAALPFRLPLRYQTNMDDLKRLQWGHFSALLRLVLKPFLFQATLWGGSCGSVFLRRAAGSSLTTLTPTRSACLTADVHGNANTYPGICRKVSTSWPKEWWLPDTLVAAIQAAPSRFGSWSWAMRATTTSGLRQTNRSGDGPPPTPLGSMWQVSPSWICRTDVGSHRVCVCDPDLQVQVHPARHANTFGFGETVFVGCQARGCAAPGRNLALYRCERCNSPLKIPTNDQLMLCTQEWTESWLLREVDGNQSLRPPTCWSVYLSTDPTTEGPFSSGLPGAWVWVQKAQLKAELSLCFVFYPRPVVFILLPCRFSPLHLHNCLPGRRGDRGGVCHSDLQHWCSSTCRELRMVQR